MLSDEYHMPGFQSFFIGFLHLFVKTKLASSSIRVNYLTLLLLGLNLANTIIYKKHEKWLKPWRVGPHLRVLSESYPMNTNMTGFKLLRPCALEGLSALWGSVALLVPIFPTNRDWLVINPDNSITSIQNHCLSTRLPYCDRAYPDRRVVEIIDTDSLLSLNRFLFAWSMRKTLPVMGFGDDFYGNPNSLNWLFTM